MMATLPIASPRESARVVLPLLRRRRAPLIATTVLLLAGSASALAVPALLGRIVDLVLAGGDLAPVIVTAVFIVAAGALSALLAWWGGRLMVATVQGLLADLREEVFEAALTIDLETVENAGSADLVSRLTGDVAAITEAAGGVLPRFIAAAFTIGLTAVGLAAIDPFLALAAVIAVPLQVLASVRFLRRSRPLYVRLRHEESRRGQSIIESVAGAETVRAYGEQGTHLDLIAERSLTAIETQRTTARARNVYNGTLNLAEFVGMAAVLAMGLWRVELAAVTIGGVTAATLLFHRLFGPIGTLLSSIDDLQRALAGLERLAGVLSATRGTRRPSSVRDSSVSLRGVSFTYDSTVAAHSALEDVDLTIPAGSCTVLVGASGSGKSTVARLVAGLAAPQSGTVLIGGVPATHAARADGRPAVMLVTQESHLFRGTIADNLRIARSEASDLELQRVLGEVGADWISTLPDSIDAPASEDLGPQRIQQLALARVLLADPPVVILDEATAHAGSALDASLAAVIRERTAIIIAHRLTHAEHADLIAVFQRGRIAEHGSAEQLLSRRGSYYELWSTWKSGQARSAGTQRQQEL